MTVNVWYVDVTNTKVNFGTQFPAGVAAVDTYQITQDTSRTGVQAQLWMRAGDFRGTGDLTKASALQNAAAVPTNVAPTVAVPGKITSAASTNQAVLKATPGRISAIFLANTTASWKFLRLYDRTTVPTVGTTVPTYVYGIPPNSALNIVLTINFTAGIAYSLTGGSADLDATATAVADVVGTITFA